METTETFKRVKVLMFGNMFVDANLLEKGIYATNIPVIYHPDTTIESKIEQGKFMRDMMGAQMIGESYFENLKKCRLVDYYLSPINQAQGKECKTCRDRGEIEVLVMGTDTEWVKCPDCKVDQPKEQPERRRTAEEILIEKGGFIKDLPIQDYYIVSCKIALEAMQEYAREGVPSEEVFTRTQIEQLQSEVYKITGKGEVMKLFNNLLGVQAG